MNVTEETTSPQLLLSHEKIPMPASTEGIVSILRRVLSKPYIQSVSLRSGHPIEVSWYKDISDSLSMGEPEESPDSVLSRVDLEEFSSGGGPKETLLDAMIYLNQQHHHATHLFVGSVEFFKKWVGIPSVVVLPKFEETEYYNFIGMSLLEVSPLPEDVVVVLAAKTREATRTELMKGLKIIT